MAFECAERASGSTFGMYGEYFIIIIIKPEMEDADSVFAVSD